MTLQLATLTRNARLDAMNTEIGASPILKIFSGTPPSNCSSANTGDLLVTMTLPSTWLASAASGAISKSGTWTGIAGDDGDAGHFRIFDSGGTVVHMQGTVTATSGGGDIELDNVSIASGQTITISTFTITDGNT